MFGSLANIFQLYYVLNTFLSTAVPSVLVGANTITASWPHTDIAEMTP